MDHVLNTKTNTAHKPRDDGSPLTTRCGSMVSATHDRTRVVTADEVRNSATIDRCGRCFEDVTGY